MESENLEAAKRLIEKNLSRLTGRKVLSVTNNYTGVLKSFRIRDSLVIDATIVEDDGTERQTVLLDVLIEND